MRLVDIHWTAEPTALLSLSLYIKILEEGQLTSCSIMQALESGLLTLEYTAASSLLALCLKATAAADADLR